MESWLKTLVRRLKFGILQCPECWNSTSVLQVCLRKQRIYLLCTAGKYKGRSPSHRTDPPALHKGCCWWEDNFASGGCSNISSATAIQQHCVIRKASLDYKQHNEFNGADLECLHSGKESRVVCLLLSFQGFFTSTS